MSTPSPSPAAAPQQVQLDPLLRASIQVRTLNALVNSMTDELTFAHQQGAELEKKLAAALAENETLLKEKIEATKADLAAQVKINAALDAELEAGRVALLEAVAKA